MNYQEDFDTGVGTYLKVLRFAEPSNPDGVVPLCLRPQGRFLLLGYWRGHGRSVAAGQWTRSDARVLLEGRGQVSCDVVPGPGSGEFTRAFTTVEESSSPGLSAETELAGWSLLGWRGLYAYVGRDTVISPDGRWLPKSLADVDAWIDRLAGA